MPVRALLYLSVAFLALTSSCAKEQEEGSNTPSQSTSEPTAITQRQRAATQIVDLAEAEMARLPNPEESEIEQADAYRWHAWQFAYELASELVANDPWPAHEPQTLTYAQCFDRINNTLTPQEREFLLLYGDLESLCDRPEACWEMTGWPQLRMNTICAFFDSKTDELILLWVAPEG